MTAHSVHHNAAEAVTLPSPLDSETVMLLRTFLLRHFEQAQSWDDLRKRMRKKGYEIAFRAGHLVLINEQGDAICTGSMLGSPLAKLAQRLGRPKLRVDQNGAASFFNG